MANGNKKRRRSTAIGLAVVLAFGSVFTFAVNADTGLFPGRVVKAAFSDISALRPGNEVRIGSVRAGQVSSIELVDGQPVVTMKLTEDRPVHEDASAAILARSALGQKYVDLDLGTPNSGRLGPDGIIPARRTGDAKDVTKLLDAFDAKTRNALGSTVREVGGGALGHTKDVRRVVGALPEMLPDLAGVSRALSADSGAGLRQLLDAGNRLAKSFEGRERHLGELAANLADTLHAVDVDDGAALADTLKTAPEALATTRAALRDLQRPLADVERAMTELQPGARALGEATPDLRGVLREGRVPLKKVPGVAEEAEPAVSSLTTTMRDARPLAPAVREALATADRPLADIAPFAPEISAFFTHWSDALQFGDKSGHHLRIYPPLGPESATGLLPMKDPTVSREVYTEPGEAPHQRERNLIGTRGEN